MIKPFTIFQRSVYDEVKKAFPDETTYTLDSSMGSPWARHDADIGHQKVLLIGRSSTQGTNNRFPAG